MSDPLREQWKKQLQQDGDFTQVPVEQELKQPAERRKHKDFVVNTRNSKICISGLGPDGFVVLEVAGQDAFGKAFYNISNIPDKVLDTNMQYSMFLEKKYIQEITIEQYKKLSKKFEAYRKQQASQQTEQRRRVDAYKKKRQARFEGEEPESEYESFDVDGAGRSIYDPDDFRNYI